jgi:ferredoxin-NADP reductase
MSMIRAHGAAESQVPVGLIYSVRSPADVIYASELSERTVSSPLTVDYRYTRSARPGVRPGRIDAAAIAKLAPPPAAKPDIFVCGPSGFVEAATSLLVDAGHAAATIKTERFGPTGT